MSEIRPRRRSFISSLRIAADTLRTRALHPNPFEAHVMSTTYETVH
jgi:hypothetical protein